MKNDEPIITSIAETDLYKLSMQQAVIFRKFMGVAYESIDVEYEFINRGKHRFPPGFADLLTRQIHLMSEAASLSPKLKKWLGERSPYFKRSYLDILSGYRFDPCEVTVEQNGDDLRLLVKGPWYRTILWEVPLMALICELYYRAHNLTPVGLWIERAGEKSRKLEAAGVKYADFGTRRRFSAEVHRGVTREQKYSAPSSFVGSSNVMLAYELDLLPVGTHAHEWFQAHAALFGYCLANRYALEAWSDEYDGNLGTALTDTFTTDAFFKQFSSKHAMLFTGVRHDSGDPIVFAQKAIDFYKSLSIDPLSKTIIFSDGLTVDTAIAIHHWCEGKIQCAFGIGTSLTNDVGHQPMNIVIKMTRCNGRSVVKLSDVTGKISGDPRAVEHCRFEVGH